MKLILVITCFLLGFTGMAQDPHFSQYFSSPLTLNPATTGYFDGDYRIAGNFRTQWIGIGSPFVTGTVSYDNKLMKDALKNDIFSIGVLGLYDQSLNGGFKSSNVSVSTAYHKSLDAGNRSRLGIGFQGTYATRAVNSNGLSFASQFNGNGFDPSLPSNENLGILSEGYFDINLGMLYSYQNEKIDFYMGGSLYHVGSPNISFITNGVYKLPQRYTIHAGSKFTIGENQDQLFIGGLYMKQANTSDKILGTSYGVHLNNDHLIYGGIWYRIDDAIIPYASMSYGNFQLGISYDVTSSSLRNYAGKNGSFELSLIFLGGQVESSNSCPRF